MRADFILFPDWKREKRTEALSKYLLNELPFRDLHCLKTLLFIDYNQGEPNMYHIHMILKSPTLNSLIAWGGGENLHAPPVLISMATGTPRKFNTLKQQVTKWLFQREKQRVVSSNS